mmetsp:Transcript_15469/g.35840  ORF Transcript_15469/g.35840 Transcript_15469/m.35840 type:complete len:246 (-) Transcript_15469:68-805(-)
MTVSSFISSKAAVPTVDGLSPFNDELRSDSISTTVPAKATEDFSKSSFFSSLSSSFSSISSVNLSLSSFHCSPDPCTAKTCTTFELVKLDGQGGLKNLAPKSLVAGTRLSLTMTLSLQQTSTRIAKSPRVSFNSLTDRQLGSASTRSLMPGLIFSRIIRKRFFMSLSYFSKVCSALSLAITHWTNRSAFNSRSSSPATVYSDLSGRDGMRLSRVTGSKFSRASLTVSLVAPAKVMSASRSSSNCS